jgi:Tol biopolymer transport system component
LLTLCAVESESGAASAPTFPNLLEKGVPGCSPAWSPDGEKIAYVTGVIDGNETIHLINADGAGRKPLADGN